MRLDRLISIMRSELIDTGFGMEPGPYEPIGTLAARREDVSDAEQWRAHEVQASVTTRFTVRWSPFGAAITPKDRIEHEGETFEITGTKQVGRRRFIEITTSARTDQ